MAVTGAAVVISEQWIREKLNLKIDNLGEGSHFELLI